MTRVIITIMLMLACCSESDAQDQWKNVYSENAWAERDQWQKAGLIISGLNLKSGGAVADLGCHEGYMTFKLSKVVGTAGKVYAVDVDRYKLDKLKGHADEGEVKNISVIQGTQDDPGLPPGQLDAVLILDTYHEMREHNAILMHVKAALKTGGRLVVCEALADGRKGLPRSEQEAKHEIGMEYVVDDLKNNGFGILKTEDPFVDRTKEKGDKMWLIIAVKK